MPNPTEKEWTKDRIAKLRSRLDLTQRAAAELVGATHSLWSHWEAGRHKPTKPFQKLLTLIEKEALESAD